MIYKNCLRIIFCQFPNFPHRFTLPVMKLITCIFLMISLHTLAQSKALPKGNWSYKMRGSKIIQLSWDYPGMPRNEQISEAVPVDNKALPKKITETAVSSNGVGFKTIDGVAHLALSTKTTLQLMGFDSGHVRGIKLNLNPGSAWYGGGERTLPMNRVGQRISLYNNPHYGYELNADELNYSVPFVMSTEGYGILFDNPSKGYMDFGKTTAGILEAGFASGKLDLYIVIGNTPEEILANYANITGKQPLPPRWALGNFVSRFGYRSEEQVKAVVAQMKKDRFPLDAVIIDIFWFGDSIKGTLGNLDFVNKTKWPAPEKMIADFNKQAVKTILVTEPFFLKGTKNFEASLPYLATDSAGKPFMLTDFYFGYGGLLDMFKPQSQQWFWQFYKNLSNKGVAGWWGDLGEPEKHPEGIYHNLSNLGIKRLMAANEVHNMYGHMWSKMLYTNWTKTYPNKRLFYLNRAGFAGSHRFSVFPWTGDVSRSWNGFRAQLPNLQSMSLSGIPYIHSDAGGFSMTDKDDPELYIRWLQMACFTPIFRPHGTALGDLVPDVKDIPSEPVLKPEPYKTMARNVVNQRYQLLPYNYNLAWQQASNGTALIRPMFFSDFTDSNLQKATNQYMWGDALLIAPVLEAGAKTRELYLPKANWYNFYNNSQSAGGIWKTDTVTLETMPVYVKAGSFVPHWDALEYNNTTNYNMAKPLTIRYYPATKSSHYNFYDDDGESRNAPKDSTKHQLLNFEAVTNTASGITLSINARNWPKNSTRKIIVELPLDVLSNTIIGIDKAVNGFLVNNTTTPPGMRFTNYAQMRWQQFEVNFTGQPVLLEFKW